MIKKITSFFWREPIFKGSFIVFAGSVVANLGAYLFHLAMGRFLGPANYGVLESLISISYFLGIPVGVLGLIIVKFVSQRTKDKEKTAFWIRKIAYRASLYGLAGLVAFLAGFPLLKILIKVDSFWLFLGLGITGFLGIFTTVLSATLQGVMKFYEFSAYNIFGSWSRLAIGVFLVFLGFNVGGAIWGTALATLLTIFFGYKLVNKYIPLKLSGNLGTSDLLENAGSFSIAVFLSSLSLISFFTVDIILARYFLSPVAAGQYASLSVLGKIIFFASSPIISVMFPLVSEKHANGNDYRKVIGLSFLMVLVISLTVSTVYFVFPKLMVGILFGSSYLETASLLGKFAIFISIYSLCSLLLNFYLSISKLKIIFSAVLFGVLQIVLINFYHQDINQIVSVNIFTLSLLLFWLVAYFTKTCLSK